MINTGNTELNHCYKCMALLEPGQAVCPVCGNDNRVKQNPVNTLPEGTILAGKYLVGQVLGQGGFGITYIGINIYLKLRVAIKEYFPITACVRSTNLSDVVPIASAAKKDTFNNGLDEFQTEASRLASLNSPNIVKVLDFFRENGTSYIVMNYLEGNSLTKEVAERGGRLPWQEIPELFGPLILEIDKLHKDHLLHRDIKPDNIKVVTDKDGKKRLILLDFGSARNFTSADVSGSYTAYVTAGYAPYEQYIRHGKQGPYTDIYSVCATMYAALTGKIPDEAIARKGGDTQLKDPAELGIAVPAGLSRAIMHGLAVNSRERPQSMRELYDELYAEQAPEEPKAETTVSPAEEPKAETTVPPAEDPMQILYEDAKRLMSAGSRSGYAQALQLFGRIPGFKDADSLAEICRRKSVPPPPPPPPPRTKKKRTIFFILLLAAAAVMLLNNKNNKFSSQITPQQAVTRKPTATLRATPTEEPLPTAKPTKKPTNIGDIITLGQYEQDGSTENGAEAVEWLVLAVEGDRALVISRYSLDAKPYNEKNQSVTWESCTLRTWLNGEFYNSVFSSEEKGRIRRQSLRNPDNGEYGTKGGNATSDRIFLLSIEEAEKYFKDDNARKCLPTAYTKNREAGVDKESGTVWWWLRTPGSSSKNAAGVNYGGVVRSSGGNVNYSSGTVRPAFWLDL